MFMFEPLNEKEFSNRFLDKLRKLKFLMQKLHEPNYIK